MILVINQKESAALTLHLAIMRKNFRKLIKRDYKARRDVLNDSYDYLLESAREALECQNEEIEMYMYEKELEVLYEVYVNEIDLEVLCAFLSSYVDKLGELKLDEEMSDQLRTMKELQLRCEELMQHEHETA